MQILLAPPAFPTRRTALAALGVGAMGALPACAPGPGVAAAHAARLRRPLDTSMSDPLPELVRFATLGANGHNTQPWLFKPIANGVEIRADFSRRTPVVDPDDHHLFVSLGCAAENLALAATAYGRSCQITFDPAAQAVTVVWEATRQAPTPLLEAIPRRQCTRTVYDGKPVPAERLAALHSAASVDGVDMRLITARDDIDRVRDAVIEGNRVQMRDAGFVAELLDWIRFSEAGAIAKGDGLFSAASGNPTPPDWVGRMIFPMVFTQDGETKKYRAQLNSSAGIAVFTGATETPTYWVQVGRAYQRFALQATLLGIKNAFVNQPVEVASMRAGFAEAVGFKGRRVDLVVRFGHAPDLPFSLRRPVDAVLTT